MLLPFFQTSWGVGVLNSAVFNSFHNRGEFGTILEGLRNFGGGGLNPPLGTPLNTGDTQSSVSLAQLATSILLHDDAGDTNFMNLVLLRTKGFFHIGDSTRVHRKSQFLLCHVMDIIFCVVLNGSLYQLLNTVR